MKTPKPQAEYRGGSPQDCCGYCMYYTGGACTMVEGRISPFQICKFYKPFKNPYKGQYSIVKKATATPVDDWTGNPGA
jgi:hypothetical protein